MTNHLATIASTQHFFPVVLVKVRPDKTVSVVQHLGTGFFVLPRVVVTCWHCVEAQLQPDQRYAIRVKNPNGTFSVAALEHIERDQNGTDLATANCDYAGAQPLTLATMDLWLGEEVWTFGFPYPETQRRFDGSLNHVISGRVLRGYVTRHFYYQHPSLGKTDAYELDMRAPAGTSGAALLRKDTLELVGVVFGVNDVETVESFAFIDPATGAREPELRRVVSFALAYDTETLARLSTSATAGIPLARCLGMDPEAFAPAQSKLD